MQGIHTRILSYGKIECTLRRHDDVEFVESIESLYVGETSRVTPVDVRHNQQQNDY